MISVMRNLTSPGTIDTNSFAEAVDFGVNLGANLLAIADFDSDGKPDIAFLTQGGVTLLPNISTGPGINNGTFAEPVFVSIYPDII